MRHQLCLVVIVVALLAVAAGSRDLLLVDVGAISSRQLLQKPTRKDCQRSVPKCAACKYQFFQGTTTKAVCTACDPGFTVKPKSGGRACVVG